MHGRCMTLAFQAEMHNRGPPITVEEKTESLVCNIFNIDIEGRLVQETKYVSGNKIGKNTKLQHRWHITR